MKFNETEIAALQALIKEKKPVTIKGFNNYGDPFTTRCYILSLKKEGALENSLLASEERPDKNGKAPINLVFSTGTLSSEKYLKRPRLFVSGVFNNNKIVYANQNSRALRKAAKVVKEGFENENALAFAYPNHSVDSRAAQILKANIAKTLTITQMYASEGNSFMFSGTCLGIDYAKTAKTGRLSFNLLVDNCRNELVTQSGQFVQAKQTFIEDKNDNFLLIDSIN